MLPIRYPLGLLALLSAGGLMAAPAYVADPNSSQSEVITDFDAVLKLTATGADNAGLSVAERRNQITFDPSSSSFADADSDLSDVSSEGSLTSYLYKFLDDGGAFDADANAGVFGFTGNLSLDPGTTSATPNLPVIVDLGEVQLDVSGNFEAQGALLVSTVNSFASSGGLSLDGVGSLNVDTSRTGRLEAGELLEISSGNPANFKLALDLNSTLQNGASFVFAEETSGSASLLVSFDVSDASNSRLFDTSYVINSSALRSIDGSNNERITVTFSRDNDEYITKSFTANHPSNDAALKLGTIAADGVALGDLQTALTLLDINDFGFGDTAANLATEVKRLAPIANNSHVISSLGGLNLASDSIDYRIATRRGNWSGYSELDQSIWMRGLASRTDSSGSVPASVPGAQDNAGHDGFDSKARGFSFGFDHAVDGGLIGLSFSRVATAIDQDDDRLGEGSDLEQRVFAVYGQVNDRKRFASLSLSHANGWVDGFRRTAVGRTADFRFSNDTSSAQLRVGQRFDLSDGRPALPPTLALIRSDYGADAYTETGAGDLSLSVEEQQIDLTTIEVGATVSHKRRIGGVKALSLLNLTLGKDASVSDQTVTAHYTGATHTAHSDYTTFTTPAEQWARNYLSLGADLQLEPADAMMIKLGVDAEFRHGRQTLSGELGFVWVF